MRSFKTVCRSAQAVENGQERNCLPGRDLSFAARETLKPLVGCGSVIFGIGHCVSIGA